MTGYSREALQGTWAHSHEEDGEGEMVLRPGGHPFPPSRGRAVFELRPDGRYLERSPGPVDAPEEHSGEWSLAGDRVVLKAEGDRPERTWQIVAAERDRLVVKE